MAGEWRPSNWGDEVTLEYGKAIRGYSRTHGKYRVFGSNGPIGWTSEALTQGPGVILGRKGAYRGVEYWREPFWVIDTAYYLVPKTELDMRWLYYAVKHYKLGEIDDGSPIPSTTRAAVYMLELDVPPKEEQRAIAHILGTLDDKIELNRRRNQTLEAMARALFKDWFVDFGPVRAKMEGREPYLPADLWQLFPDRLDDEGKPEGWEIVPASGLIEFNPTEPLRKGTPAPYLDMASLPTSGSWPEPPITRDFGSGMRFRNGDTLLARITPCLENGKTAFVQCLPDDTVGWGSTEYIVMRPKKPVPAGYAYLLARDDAFREYAIRSMTGTSGRQRAQGDSVAAFKIASPLDENLWHAFARQITPIFDSIKSSARASETLSALRDTLLPKLISGELRVADAEQFLKRAEDNAKQEEEPAMTTHNGEKPVKAFKAPREVEWRPLEEKPDDEAQQRRARNNQEELHNMLLGSLQMQHVVVLAGSGCSLAAGAPSMSDLWNVVVGDPTTAEATAAAATVNHDIKIKNIEALLSRIEASLQLNEEVALRKFLNDSKKTILKQCSDFLDEEKLAAHRQFLHRLSRRRVRDQRLKIFTTNYDLCFERAASALGGIAIDGFSFTAPRRYDPRYFNYDLVRRPRSGDDASYLEGVFLLYKLHGSVSWARKSDGTLHEEANPSPDQACLIYPAAGKYQQSFSQPHLESMAQYLAAVREPNTCVVVAGFGFNDDHLSEPLLAAAQSNPHLRLIIVDPYAERQTTGKNEYWQEFNTLACKGEDIWFVAADFEAFSEMVPDLKSLTPADTLMKAIQGAIKPS